MKVLLLLTGILRSLFDFKVTLHVVFAFGSVFLFVVLLSFLILVHLVSLFAAGNMRHLIVEACIARNLLDTSAYFWPGYVNGRINQIPHSIPPQVLGWSSFMKGAPLSPVMINALVSTPASR